MNKSEKSSKNKKPKLVLIYGTIAAGKLTVAKELEKITGFHLVHNHVVIDFVKDVFPKKDAYQYARSKFRQDLGFDVLKLLMDYGVSVIITLAYAHNYVSKTGLSDQEWVRKIKRIAETHGGVFYPVHLHPSKEEVIRRVGSPSRKKFAKINDPKKLREILKTWDYTTGLKYPDGFSVDNTSISAKKVAQMVKKHFKL